MPERNLTVVTYAAGASLAAITLIYVFGPTYFLDGGEHVGSGVGLSASAAARKKGVVGLANPANDCFINSTLQALAGLGDLRLYLIRETHRRNIDDPSVYATPVPEQEDEEDEDGDDDGTEQPPEEAANGSAAEERRRKSSKKSSGQGGGTQRRATPAWKLEGLQRGIVTKGLKDILDALNERPIYKKTITAAPFVRVLETAFRQRISRQQQDAQELLQVVAERLCDEYHAGRRARRYARRQALANAAAAEKGKVAAVTNGAASSSTLLPNGVSAGESSRTATVQTTGSKADVEDPEENEDGFPMEGAFESQIECLTCKFKPKPTESTFCTLTLNVPQQSTTLSACFDSMFKTEYIDDFKCEKCRLLHARDVLEAEMAKARSEAARDGYRDAIAKLQTAIDTDPEKPPEDVALPDPKDAPRRRIARYNRLTKFPKILAIHLSRSIYDAHVSQKNSAKVSFPERLPLGPLLSQRQYKLLGLVTHKGSHQSGHYESFRRQNIYPPFSTPNTFQPSGVYSKFGVPISTAQTAAASKENGSLAPSTPDLQSASSDAGVNSSTPSLESSLQRASLDTNHLHTKHGSPNDKKSLSQAPTSAPRDKDKDKDGAETSSLRSAAASARSVVSRMSHHSLRNESATKGASENGQASAEATPETSKAPTSAAPPPVPKPKRRKQSDRWWRISDDKIKEARTSEVLGMQREVYLLFYELERGDNGRRLVAGPSGPESTNP